MKTKSEHFYTGRTAERGNALIYVLVAIVLFAALSFTLSRQNDGGTGNLSEEKAELYATQLISYAAAAKDAYNKMEFTGTRYDTVGVQPPDHANFNAGSPVHKIFHPEGGGLNPGNIPEQALADGTITDPAPGWYLGSAPLNVDWTATPSDVILTAYGISERICGIINETVTGSTDIPTLASSTIKETLIARTVDGVNTYSTGANTDLTTDPSASPICAECENRASLCVQQGGIYAFYSIIAER